MGLMGTTLDASLFPTVCERDGGGGHRKHVEPVLVWMGLGSSPKWPLGPPGRPIEYASNWRQDSLIGSAATAGSESSANANGVQGPAKVKLLGQPKSCP